MRSSRPLTGNFEKWNATLTFASRDPTSAVMNVEIQAASVYTPGGKNDDKLKSRELLDVQQNPTISFKSDKVVQTGKTTFDVDGTFTMRGVSKPATLNLVIADQGGGGGYAQGILSFNRSDFGMAGNSDNSVEVDLNIKVEQVSGPQLIRSKRFR
ncbi:MAG: YceI family protein [Silvibacterium sp.]|nr:YceI family protein [Silvibacterium sp.]